MLDRPLPAEVRASRWVPIATVALAVAVFIVDTVTPFDINVGLFYLPVLLLGARFLHGRKLVLLAAAGAALSATSFLINLLVMRSGGAFAGGVNMLGIVIPAIALMTWLLLQGQARLRKVREQAGLVNLTRAAMFSRGMDDRIVFWNRGAEELYGRRAAEAIGKVTHDLLKTVFPEPLAEINARLLGTGRWEGELVHTRRDGETVFVESRWSLQRDEHGQPALILETNNDVTQRKAAQESLRRAEADLTRIHRVLLVGELTASIAHEINQPLAAVGANAGAALRFLGRSPPNVERAREALDMAVAENARASAIITRVRGLVKNAPIQTQVVVVNDVIRDAIALTHAKLRRHGVKLVTGLADGMAPVAADPLQLQQVLMNLVTNAVDAMEGVADRPRELTITSGADGTDQALVEVRDTGVGFETAGAERLFESFYTTKTGGMGTGLADLPLHHRRPWRTAVGGAERASRRRVPVRAADAGEADLTCAQKESSSRSRRPRSSSPPRRRRGPPASSWTSACRGWTVSLCSVSWQRSAGRARSSSSPPTPTRTRARGRCERGRRRSSSSRSPTILSWRRSSRPWRKRLDRAGDAARTSGAWERMRPRPSTSSMTTGESATPREISSSRSGCMSKRSHRRRSSSAPRARASRAA